MRGRVLFALCLVFALENCARPPSLNSALPSALTGATPTRAAQAARPSLQDAIAGATRMAGVQRATWGVVVRSLDRDESLVELNPDTLLVPASTAKLLSTAAALDAVGWDYRFETTVRANGVVVDGVLHGDLLITGSGDPSIGGRGGDDFTAWIDALRATGLRRIEGRIIGDDDALEEPRAAISWAWDDLGYTYGALFGALNFAENRMAVTVTPGPSPGGTATLAVDPAAVSRPLLNRTTTGEPGTPALIWPEQRPGEASLSIAGSMPVGAAPARIAVSAGNPTLWFASVFRNRLLAAGIEITGEAVDIDDAGSLPPRTAQPVLYVHRSRPLRDIVAPMLKESINLYAEAVMRLGIPAGVFPTNDAALDGVRQHLGPWGVPKDGFSLVDGSGLSRRDLVTARTLVTVLQHDHDPAGLSPWMTALPIAGVDGSLENRMKGTPAERNLRAKTGSMSNIRSLAGYVTARDGERLVFAVIVNNFEGTAAQAHAAIDAMAVSLATFSRAN